MNHYLPSFFGRPAGFHRLSRWVVLAFVLVSILLAACAPTEKPVAKAKPVEVIPIGETELKLVKLTEKAAQRIGIQTVIYGEEVVEKQIQVDNQVIPATGVENSPAKVVSIPYSSILYDVKGVTWVYISPEPLTFMRFQVDVARIEGDRAILRTALPDGSKVVTTGTVELYGAETGVGK